VDGVFIYVGQEPASGFLRGEVELDEQGYVLGDAEMRTSAGGVFCAGDLRRKGLRQIVTACADGAVAAVACERWLVDRGPAGPAGQAGVGRETPKSRAR
jgi:thioredoxin reductase (NADPH)